MGGKLAQRKARKYFSIEQANYLLHAVDPLMRRVMKLNRALDLLATIEIEVYDEDYDTIRKVTKLNKQFHKLSYEFYNKIEKLEDIGCLVHDLEAGVVDFHSRLSGRDVFLSWKLGETKIQYWHELDEGYLERRPIPDMADK